MEAEEYYYLGNKYQDEEEYIKAISYYTKAIEQGYKNADIYRKRGACYFIIQQYNEAIKDLTEAINIQPTDYDYRMRSHCYNVLGMNKEAEADEKIYKQSDKLLHERANELFKEIDELFGTDYNETKKQFHQKSTKGRKLDL